MRDFIHQVALQRTFTKGLRFYKNVNCRFTSSHIFCARAGIVGPSTGVSYDMCQKFLKFVMTCVGPKIIFSVKVMERSIYVQHLYIRSYNGQGLESLYSYRTNDPASIATKPSAILTGIEQHWANNQESPEILCKACLDVS